MRQTNFWQWYGEVNDDIRQKVVEQGWFGREVTGSTQDSFSQGEEASPFDTVPQIEAEPVSDFYDTSRSDEPEAADLYGTAWQQEPSMEPEQEEPKFEMQPEPEQEL